MVDFKKTLDFSNYIKCLGVAVRRSDLNLTKTCFDALWSIDKEKFIRKLPVLIAENAWFLIYDILTITHVRDKEKAYRRVVYRLCFSSKCFDTHLCMMTAGYGSILTEEQQDHIEYRLLSSMTSAINSNGITDELIDSIYKECMLKRGLHNVDKTMLMWLRLRALEGGSSTDIKTLLAAAILIATRGLNKRAVEAMIEENCRGVKDRPVDVPIPWYGYTHNHAYGSAAVKYISKRTTIPQDNIRKMWFFFCTYSVDMRRAKFVATLDKSFKMFDNYWWLYAIRMQTAFGGNTAKESKKLWSAKLEPVVKKIVERGISNGSTR